ncbi:PorV/PorQ family protein [bacterium]|nr:PorV/PorQ family protein [bacterium]
MKRYFILLLAITLFLPPLNSYAGSVSQAGLLFLKISPGARPSGMGEAFVALADDATATWWNPAGLAFVPFNELTLMHTNWLPQFKFSDLYYDFVSYTHYAEDWGTFGGNIIFLNYGEIQRTNEIGQDLGSFNAFEVAFSGAYGSQVTPNLGLGVSMKFVYSMLSPYGAGTEKGSGKASVVAVDIGTLYKTTFLPGLQLGANLSNMGPKVAYIDRAQADPLPTNLKFGLAYKVLEQEYNRFTVTFDVDKELVTRKANGESDPFYIALFTSWYNDGGFMSADELEEFIWHMGAEYWYGDMVGLRAGYWNDSLGKVKPMTFGLSVKYSAYRFDFGYMTAGENHPVTDTMRFSLTFGL